jgi:4-hydroxybenzoate polyprenyltransferase
MDAMRAETSATAGDRLRAFATLVRLPNVFTAPPDVIAGAALAAAVPGTSLVVGESPGGDGVAVVEVVGLALASASIYAAGTTLNDYFDADVDAVERPERPIPSGRVAPAEALAVGVVLIIAGIALALASTGLRGLVVATALSGLVVAYDALAKGTRLGYLLMGSTRGANVLLGTTTVAFASGIPAWILSVPAAVTAYVAAVTWMAADEARGGDRIAIAAVAVLAVAATAVPPVLTAVATDGLLRPTVAAVVALAFLGFVGRPLASAYRDPSPSVVGPTVGKCVLGLVVYAGSVATVAGLAWTAAALAFLVPATGLARVFDVS